MENFKIEVEEMKTYKQRMKSILTLVGSLLMAFSLFLYFMPLPNKKISDLYWFFTILYIFVLVSLVSLLISDMVCAYHIRFLEIKDNRMRITYTKRGKHFELESSLNKLDFSYRARYNTPAFIKIIYDNDRLIARQYRAWGWKTEGAFDQIKKYLEEHKLLGTAFSTF